jgi:hypothetical protein
LTVVHRATVNWPGDRPKTQYRKPGTYGKGRITPSLAVAVERVVEQVSICSNASRYATNELTICVHAEIGVKGIFLSRYRPSSPEVVVSFDLNRDPITLACDTFTEAEQNLCAIAATIEDLRRAERNGVLTLKQMLGAAALPEPMGRAWWIVLAVDETATTAQIDAAYRTLAKEKHPDTGGSHEAMAELNVAYEQAKLARGNNG